MADETEYESCERCGRSVEPEMIHSVELESEWSVCDGCVRAMEDNTTYHDWRDRYTEEQHERAVSLLVSRDEFECVLDDYSRGQIAVHTPYVSSDVVLDFCKHFGFEIAGFWPRWEQEERLPCSSEHGSTFEIILEYNTRSSPPIPTSVEFDVIRLDRLDEIDKQF